MVRNLGESISLRRARGVWVAEGRRDLVSRRIAEGARFSPGTGMGDSGGLKGGQDAGLVGRGGAGGLDHGLGTHGGGGHQLVLHVDKDLNRLGSDKKRRHRKGACRKKVLAQCGLHLALNAQCQFGCHRGSDQVLEVGADPLDMQRKSTIAVLIRLCPSCRRRSFGSGFH